MPRCKYSNYVTLLPCNQFHRRGAGGQALTGGVAAPWPPLRTATGTNNMSNCTTIERIHTSQTSRYAQYYTKQLFAVCGINEIKALKL